MGVVKVMMTVLSDILGGHSSPSEVQVLLEQQRKQLGKVNAVLSGQTDALNRLREEKLLRQYRVQRSKSIWGAYLAREGIRSVLEEIVRIIEDEMEEIDDLPLLRARLETNRLMIAEYKLDTLKRNLADMKPPETAVVEFTEEALAPLGWHPVKERLLQTIEALEQIPEMPSPEEFIESIVTKLEERFQISDDPKPVGGGKLSELSNRCEENVAIVDGNLKRIRQAQSLTVEVAEDDAAGFDDGEALLTALNELMSGEVAALYTIEDMEHYTAAATQLAAAIQTRVLDPFPATQED